MISFGLFLREQEEKASSNTKGVLHEILVGHYLNNAKHMDKHPAVTGESPQQVHDRLKSTVSKDEYKKIHDRAKAAADDIRAKVGGKVKHVHWTSKPGDLHRSTGIHASQEEDASDIVVTDHKGKHHGISLKVTDKNTGHVPVSNPGMEATHGGHEILNKHRAGVLKAHPKLKGLNKAARKEYMKNNPKAEADIKKRNSKVLTDLVDHVHTQLSNMSTEELADHLRHKILKANPTPMQQEGHNHIRHTTYGNNTFHHADPANDHEDVLKNHKHLTVEKSGTSIIFKHKGKKVARHRMKFESQSDPMSSVKGSGEIM